MQTAAPIKGERGASEGKDHTRHTPNPVVPHSYHQCHSRAMPGRLGHANPLIPAAKQATAHSGPF